MATALDIATRFTAIDKFSPVVKKMTQSTQIFSDKAVKSFTRVQRVERKMRRGFSKSIGVVGQLGIGLGALEIGRTILNANIELESSLKSLLAVTGVSADSFKGYESEIDKVAKSQRKFAGDVASAFEVVGSAQPQLLENAKSLSQVTDASITLSKASGDELAPSAQYLTGVMNQFSLEATEATRTMNVLAAATVAGDTKISQTAEAFKVAGSEAKMSGLNIEQLSGSIALISKFGYKGAEAGTKLRAVFSKMSLGDALPKEALTRLKSAGVDIKIISDKTVPYIDRLKELSKIQNDSATLAKMFGSENKGVAAIMLQNIPTLEKTIGKVTGTSAATDMASIKTNTLANKWKELTDKFKNSITSTDQSNKKLQVLHKILDFVIRNLDTILVVIGSLIAALLIFKIVMAAVGVVTFVATYPISLIVVAIMAMIAAIYLAINNWEKWGALMVLVLGPLGLIISMIQMLRKHWEGIRTAFQNEGIIGGLRAIGIAIIDMVLTPVQQLLELLSNIPIIGDTIAVGATKIEDFRKGLGIDTGESELAGAGKGAINADATQMAVNKMLIENKGNATLNINDKSGLAKLVENNGLDINLSQTGQY